MRTNDDLDRMLQECLDAYTHGLSVEECLSAFPGHHSELEPLLRQALRLRVAFAVTPREEFQKALREKLLFVAGRDAIEAFGQQPDAEFIERARQHFLQAAGARVQESLRDIPPPRLAFWANARRRFLNAASTPRPATQPAAVLARAGFAMGGVAAAAALAIALYLTSLGGGTASVSAEFAQVEQQVIQIKQQTDAGVPVEPGKIVDLSQRIAAVADKITSDPSASPSLAEKLPSLIQTGKDIVDQAAKDSPASPAELAQAKQTLDQSGDKVRVFAAGVGLPPAPTTIPAAAAAPANDQASPTATGAAPKPTATSVPPPAQPTPAAGQVRLQPLASDTTYGIAWTELVMQGFRMALPADWIVIGPAFDSSGVGTIATNTIRIQDPAASIIVLANVTTGQILGTTVNPSQALLLRAPGENGKTITTEELGAKTGANLAALLRHMLDSVVYTPGAPTPAPAPIVSP